MLVVTKLSQFHFKQSIYKNVLLHIDTSSLSQLQLIPKPVIKSYVLPYLDESGLLGLALTSKEFYQLCAPPKRLVYADKLQATAKNLITLMNQDFDARTALDNLRDRSQPLPLRCKLTTCCFVIAVPLVIAGAITQANHEKESTATPLLALGFTFFCCMLSCLREGLKSLRDTAREPLTVASLSDFTRSIALEMLNLAEEVEPDRVHTFSLNMKLMRLYVIAEDYSNNRRLMPGSTLVNDLPIAEEKWGESTLEKSSSPKALRQKSNSIVSRLSFISEVPLVKLDGPTLEKGNTSPKALSINAVEPTAQQKELENTKATSITPTSKKSPEPPKQDVVLTIQDKAQMRDVLITIGTDATDVIDDPGSLLRSFNKRG